MGRSAGTDATLGPGGSVGITLGKPPVEIVVEWVEKSACVAVHAAFPVPEKMGGNGLADALMRVHLAGAATHGCAFWMLPDGGVRVGITLVGPTLGEAELLEAVKRVQRMSTEVGRRAAERSE